MLRHHSTLVCTLRHTRSWHPYAHRTFHQNWNVSLFLSRKDQRLTQQQFQSLLTMLPAPSLFSIEICDHLELDSTRNLGQIKQILSLERGHYQCHGIGASQTKFVQYLCR